jgi:hypothetical protein
MVLGLADWDRDLFGEEKGPADDAGPSKVWKAILELEAHGELQLA